METEPRVFIHERVQINGFFLCCAFTGMQEHVFNDTVGALAMKLDLFLLADLSPLFRESSEQQPAERNDHPDEGQFN
jgi:hypothetical protein